MAIRNHPSFTELRPKYGTGRGESTGRGREKRDLPYRSGKMCALGDIELSEWKDLVRQAIADAGEEPLHKQLLAYVEKHYKHLHSASERTEEALELHARRIFDDPLWVHFIDFNQTCERNDVLESVTKVQVLPECCKVPGWITKARYEYDGKSQSYCPHCGRWTNIQPICVEDAQ